MSRLLANVIQELHSAFEQSPNPTSFRAYLVTPVASALKLRLDERRLWFANEWLFKWHFIGGASVVEIDTFDGRVAQYSGLKFDGSPMEVYWAAIARGARKEILNQFEWIEDRIRRYNQEVAETAIDESAELLVDFVSTLRNAAAEKERILRGDGANFPNRRIVGPWLGTSSEEITQLAVELKKATFPPTSTSHQSSIRQTLKSDRKLAAIVVADVVGYSRLSSIDEEETLIRLQTLRTEVIDPKIAEHRGRIFNTAGDSFLMEFDSAAFAVDCWLSVQAALGEREKSLSPDQKIQLRVGIHLGDVLIDGTDLKGDTVNVAARLQGVAEPGSLCISAAVYDSIGSKPHSFEIEEMGVQHLKNIARPIRAFLIFRPDAADRLGIKLLTAFARDCPNGLGRKRYVIEDIRVLLPEIADQDLEKEVYAAADRGLVKITTFMGGSWHLTLTPDFYVQTDRRVMGWSTIDDARAIAVQMLKSGTGRAGIAHETSGWGIRRFNPAYQHLIRHMPTQWVSQERSPQYPAMSILLRPETLAALRRFTSA